MRLRDQDVRGNLFNLSFLVKPHLFIKFTHNIITIAPASLCLNLKTISNCGMQSFKLFLQICLESLALTDHLKVNGHQIRATTVLE